MRSTSSGSNAVAAQRIAAYANDLGIALAPDRLAAYQPTAGGDLEMVTTYFWNVALCQDLYLALGAVEVAMRNGIHNALFAHTGHEDWYDQIALLPREQRKIDNAKHAIQGARKTIVPGRVVSGVTFEFWTSLLSKGTGPNGYGRVLWSPNNAALIRRAFPLLPVPNDNRGYVHRRFNTIRILRNRVSHHEPIWRGVTLQNRSTITLAQIHADIVEAIGWVSPTLRDSVVGLGRFPHTLRCGYAEVEVALKRHIGV